MPPNTPYSGNKEYPDTHGGQTLPIGALVRIGLARTNRPRRSNVAHFLQLMLISMVTVSAAMAQEERPLETADVFFAAINSKTRQSRGNDKEAATGDSKIRRASFDPNPLTSRPSFERIERVAKISETDPSPLTRETARLQLIEWQYSGDPPVAVRSESSHTIRQIGFTPNVESPDFNFPRAFGTGVPSTAPFTESDGTFNWIQNARKSVAEKEHAFQLIKAEFKDDQPDVLRSPFPPLYEEDEFSPRSFDTMGDTRTFFDAPLGFTGPSSVLPSEIQESDHFVPIEDRWRVGFPEWDRYGRGNPDVDDQPYETGHWWDPYNQNVLKGDYPVIGQHTFLNITATNEMLNELREVPTGTTPFESTVRPNQEEFFGNPRQYFFTNNLRLQFNLSHGDTAFKPLDWQVRMTPVFNLNHLSVKELGVVNPDVRAGTKRFRDDVAFEAPSGTISYKVISIE